MIRRDHEQRVGDAERDQTCAELTRHYVEGRLSQDEFEERMDQALGALTRNDLYVLLRDMPRPVTWSPGPAQPVPFSRSPLWDAIVAFFGISAFLCLGLLLFATMLGYPPAAFFVFLGALGASVSLLAGQHFARRTRGY